MQKVYSKFNNNRKDSVKSKNIDLEILEEEKSGEATSLNIIPS